MFFVVVAKDQNGKSISEDDDAFENYKKTHNVKYKDKKEELLRRAQYMKCKEKIKKHNKDYAKGLKTFSMKENQFCDKFEYERERTSKGNLEPKYDYIKFTVHGKAVGVVNNTQFPPGDETKFRIKNYFTKCEERLQARHLLIGQP